MKRIHIAIVLAALLVLGAVNQAIFAKENLKQKGIPMLLELAPVDPRSLMQGDYMALRFALAGQIEARPENDNALEGSLLRAAIGLDTQGVAKLVEPGTSGALPLRYRVRKHQVWLGTNAFFFEEGSAERYSHARYGDFRLDTDSGEAILIGLRDKDFKPL